MILRLLRRRVTSDCQITYRGGSTVRRIVRGGCSEWYVDGAPASEEQARAYMRSLETRP